MCGHVPYLVSLMSKPQHVYQNQADPQAFEHLLMTEPLFTVRDLGVELADTDDTELLRNYAFNISQGIVQRVSRYFDALALMDERGEAPPARGEGGKYADSARGGVMGFGHKRNVGNQEKKPARRVAWEQQVDPAVKAERERIQKAAEEEAAEMKIQIAEMRSENERNRKEREEAVTAAKAKAAEQQVDPAAKAEKERMQKEAEEAAAAAALKAAGQDAEVAALKVQVAVTAEKERSQKAAEEAAAEVAALKEEVAALKAAEQDTKMAALKAQVAELQALAATSIALRPISVEH